MHAQILTITLILSISGVSSQFIEELCRSYCPCKEGFKCQPNNCCTPLLQEGEVCDDINVSAKDDCAEGLECLPRTTIRPVNIKPSRPVEEIKPSGPPGIRPANIAQAIKPVPSPIDLNPPFTCQKPKTLCPAGYKEVESCLPQDIRLGVCIRVVKCNQSAKCKSLLPLPAGAACNDGSRCQKGLACCYPCGIQGCISTCTKVSPCPPNSFHCLPNGCPLLV